MPLRAYSDAWLWLSLSPFYLPHFGLFLNQPINPPIIPSLRIWEILTGTDPVAMVFVPAYSRTYIANYTGSSLSVIRDTTLGVNDEPFAPFVSGIRLYSSGGNIVIHFQIPYPGRGSLRVYDIQRRLVKTLMSGEERSGSYIIPWDGKDGHNRQVPKGVISSGLMHKASPLQGNRCWCVKIGPVNF